MKIITVNGSPRGANSTSAIMISAFLSGLDKDAETVEIVLAEKDIQHCRGCYACWTNHNGCVIDDGFAGIIASAKNADIILFASPVYFGNITGLLKNFIDRMTSTANPQADKAAILPRFIMMSNCGYPSDGEFKLISFWINHFVKRMGSTMLGEYYFPNGKQLRDTTNEKAQAYIHYLSEQGAALSSL